MIDGVKVKKLKVVADERGHVMEMLRTDDELFRKFGQAYITTAYPGVVKAWHSHRVQTDNLVCVSGMVKMALFDGRKGSATHGEVNEFYLGDLAPQLVAVPPGVLHGFKTISETTATVINFATELYNPAAPDEQRLEAHSKDVPYDWARKDR
jgi:dTDP-4-dehydrorhamnose 3,5-epimerase